MTAPIPPRISGIDSENGRVFFDGEQPSRETLPSDTFVIENAPEFEFGPDHMATEPPPIMPDTDTPPPKPPPNIKRRGWRLGLNKKRASGIRALNTKDRDKLSQLYVLSAMGLMPFKPEAAKVVAKSADPCADAWIELAAENDAVRRAILAMVEGGAIMKVTAAHMPIVLALLPKKALPPVFRDFDFADLIKDDASEE